MSETKLRALIADPEFKSLSRADQDQLLVEADAFRDEGLGGAEASISAQPERGLLERARNWLVGQASEQRISEEERAAARAAGVGVHANKSDLAKAALAGAGAMAFPVAAVSAPLTTGLALAGGAAGAAVGRRVGRAAGDAVGPGVGETYGAPVGEFVGGAVGGAGATRAAAPLGRAAEIVGKRVYAAGLPEPPITATRYERPMTQGDVAEELLRPGEKVPVMAAKVRQRALDLLERTKDEKAMKAVDVALEGLPSPAAQAARADAARNLAAVPTSDLMKPGTLRRALAPVIKVLKDDDQGSAAAALVDHVQARVGALIAAGKTQNITVGQAGQLIGFGGAGVYAAGHPGGLIGAAALTAARQPVLRRALGAAAVKTGRLAQAERQAFPGALGEEARDAARELRAASRVVADTTRTLASRPTTPVSPTPAAVAASEAGPVTQSGVAAAENQGLLAGVPGTPSALRAARIREGARRTARAEGLTPEEIRRAAGPVLDEELGAASPIVPENVLVEMLDALKAMPKGGPERAAYVARATSGFTKAQAETLRRALEHLGLLVPVAAGGAALNRQ